MSIIYSYITHFHHSQQQVCDEYQLLLIVGSSLDNFTTNIQKKGWEGGGKCPFSHDHFHACMAVMVTRPTTLPQYLKSHQKNSFYKFTVISAASAALARRHLFTKLCVGAGPARQCTALQQQ